MTISIGCELLLLLDSVEMVGRIGEPDFELLVKHCLPNKSASQDFSIFCALVC
jgi:hypothetical protein